MKMNSPLLFAGLTDQGGRPVVVATTRCPPWLNRAFMFIPILPSPMKPISICDPPVIPNGGPSVVMEPAVRVMLTVDYAHDSVGGTFCIESQIKIAGRRYETKMRKGLGKIS